MNFRKRRCKIFRFVFCFTVPSTPRLDECERCACFRRRDGVHLVVLKQKISVTIIVCDHQNDCQLVSLMRTLTNKLKILLIHFIIFIYIESQVFRMLLLGLYFVLYYFKLSTGIVSYDLKLKGFVGTGS